MIKPKCFLTKSKHLRTAVFISGRGSTLQSLLDSENLNISIVVSNRRKALGLLKAKRFGIETLIFDKEKSWSWLIEQLKARQIQQIYLCGFMKILPPEFVHAWSGRIVNIHPSLLPLYAGAHGIEEALQNEGPYGVSLHLVDEHMDAGSLLLQKKIELQSDMYLEYAKVEQFLLRELTQKWAQ